MLEFINNEWVVAIVGAIVSGTILVPITYKITKILEKAKIPAEVKKCNKEILSILRRIVSEGEEVSFSIIEVLTESISRANNLEKELINTPKMFIQDLILDIYDSSYIPMNSKIEMTSKLQSLLNSDSRTLRIPQKIKLRKRELFFLVSVVVISVISVIFVLFFVIKLFTDGKSDIPKDNEDIFLFFSLISLFIPIISLSVINSDNKKPNKRLSSFFGLSGEDDYEEKGKRE